MMPIRQRKVYLVEEKSDKVDPEEKKSRLGAIREVVGLLSAAAGLFAVLLYLAGRSFAAGYFSAMNIPSYQVSFSLWEYGEVAWIPLLLYPVGMITLTSLISAVFNRIMDFVLPLLIRFVHWVKSKIRFRMKSIRFPESSSETKFWFSMTRKSFYVLLLMAVVIFTLQFVTDFGKLNGRFHVLENSTQVEISSTVPLPLDDNNLVGERSSGQDYYIYKGLYLLTANNEKYYFFRELDQETCRPVKVYVFESAESLQINLLSTVSLAHQCNKK